MPILRSARLTVFDLREHLARLAHVFMRADHAPGHLLNILCAGAVQGPVKALQARFSHETGAVIYSGTPENVGPVVKGDLLVGHIDGLSELSVRIV